jgi:hypothetical protein
MRPCDIDRSGAVWTFAPQHHKTEHHGKKREIQFGPRAQEILKPFLDRVPLPDPEKPVLSPERAEHDRAIELGRARQTRVQPSQRARKQQRQQRRAAGLRRRAPREAYDANTYARAIRRGVDAGNKQRIAKALESVLLPRVAGKEQARLARFLRTLRVNPKPEDLAHAIDRALRLDREGSDDDVRYAGLVALAAKHFETVERIPHWHPHQLRHAAATRLRKEHGLEAARVVLGHAGAAVTELYAEIDHDKARRVAQVSG